MPAATQLHLLSVPGMPLVKAGDDLAAMVIEHLHAAGFDLNDEDTIVFAQKIVSKSEGRLVDLATIVPTSRAEDIARVTLKDPRLVEVILRESRRIVRCARDVLIVEHRLGLVMANAGIDQSNVTGAGGGEFALLLPIDPDASAARLRSAIAGLTGRDVAIIINDSFGRPWRNGTVGVAIGCAGLPALLDLRGNPDLFQRRLRVTVIAHADEIAAAASLVMGQADEGQPVAVIRGLRRDRAALPATALVRAAAEDLFR